MVSVIVCAVEVPAAAMAIDTVPVPAVAVTEALAEVQAAGTPVPPLTPIELTAIDVTVTG